MLRIQFLHLAEIDSWSIHLREAFML
jgi:hypothetical protein